VGSEPVRRGYLVGGLLVCLVVTTAEITIVASAMPTIAGQLTDVQHYALVFSAYLLSSTVTMPLYGRLADLYGRKRTLLLGLLIFILGSIACGTARSLLQLSVMRLVQGMGAGAIHPITMTIIGDLYSVEERWRVQGLLASVWVVSGFFGPVLGGMVLTVASWPWIFWGGVPIALAAMGVLGLTMREVQPPKPGRLDVLGAALLSASTGILVVSCQSGVSWTWLVLAGVLLVAFYRVERKASDPILPLGLLRRDIIVVGSSLGVVTGAVWLSMSTFVPLFVQGVLGGTPITAGHAMTPIAVAWTLTTVIGQRLLVRTGYRAQIRLGFAICALSCGVLCGLTVWAARMPQADAVIAITAAMACIGVGLGLGYQPQLIAIQSSVPWAERGVATGFNQFSRSIGGTFGVGILGGVLSRRLGAAGIPASMTSALLAGHRGALTHAQTADVSGALSRSLFLVFACLAGLAVAGSVCSFFFPFVPIAARERQKPG